MARGLIERGRDWWDEEERRREREGGSPGVHCWKSRRRVMEKAHAKKRKLQRNCDSESSNERYLNSINRHHGKGEKIPATMTQTVLVGRKKEKDGERNELIQHSSRCASNQFECRSGQCIESSAECNRKYDCIDGSDETQCGRSIYIYREERMQKKEHD